MILARRLLLPVAFALTVSPLPGFAQTVKGTPGPAGTKATGGEQALRHIDPLRSRVNVYTDFRDQQSNARVGALVGRLDYEIGSDWGLRLQLPYVTVNPSEQDLPAASGMGDLLVRASYRAINGKTYSVIAAMEAVFDTATNDEVGVGTTVLSPLIYGAIDISSANSYFFPLYQQYVSVGDSARAEINYTDARPILATRWGKGLYTILDPHFVIDWERDAEFGFKLEGELGKFLNRHFGLWTRVGVGLAGDNMPQIYNWRLELGVRYLLD